jgi:hypothetical protein
MSTNLVKDEINRFLASSEPEVLCVRGKWGVGKTYTWNDCLKRAEKSDKVSLRQYSYVSLFGINSLSDFKYLIFENKVCNTTYVCRNKTKHATESVIGINVRVYIYYIIKCFRYNWRKSVKYVMSAPIVNRIFGRDATTLASFLTIRNQLICIDDLERRGAKLSVKDVFGLISFLREQRGCKIALILNSEQLEGDDKKDFQEQFEKVVDISLVYKPTPKEAVQISLKDDGHLESKISNRCIDLGITNIRIINKIKRYVEMLPKEVSNQSSVVLDQAISSLVLFSWSYLQPNEAPTLKFITTEFRRKEKLDEKEASWNALLLAYGYGWTDDFDRVLIKGVQNGFFESKTLTKLVEKANSDKDLRECREKVTKGVWTLFHNSFDNNQELVLENMYSTYMDNMRCVTPNDINSIVVFFKSLQEEARATAMLNKYVEVHDTRSAFDLIDPFLLDYEVDEDIKTLFKKRCQELACEQDSAGLLRRLIGGWSDEDISTLLKLTTDDYINLFKDNSGEKLKVMLSGILRLGQGGNATPQTQEIVKRVKAALLRIGQESPINAKRVAIYGVKIDNSSTNEKPTTESDNC